MHFLAIEIGGSKIQICAGSADGQIVDRVRFQVDRAAGGEGIRSQIAGALPELLARWRPKAIGIGYGGPVNWRTGEIIKSYHVPGWSGFQLGRWLESIAGIPALAENDSNTAAFGEATLGAGKGCNPVLYSNLGSGCGGGFVVDGRLFHGAPPGEVEIGHIRLERDGTIVEDRCAGWGIDRRIRQEIANAPESALAKLLQGKPEGGEAKALGPALAAKDPLAERILRESMSEYAFALSHAVHILHPEIIVLGGGVSLIGEPMRAAVAEALGGFLMDAFAPGPKVALSTLGEDVVPVGALALAAQRLS